MKLSRFFASTNREVMRQVRLALGPDALIVSSRRINGGVEIVAADQTAALDAETAQVASAPPDTPGFAPPEQAVFKALDGMRGELLGRIDELSWTGRLREEPGGLPLLFQHLLGSGFSTSLLRSLLDDLPAGLVGAAALHWASDKLISSLPVTSSDDGLLVPGAILALVGPTGVGKTTTVAKLAARCASRVGARSLALITTDTYRIGAYDQLKQYGQMLQVPVGVAQGPEQLAAMLEAVPADHMVLIDNTGVSQRDPRVAAQTGMLDKMPRKIKRLLVLDAASHGDTLDEVARCYAVDEGNKPVACIVTKTDEAIRLAPVLDVAMRHRLPIQYLSGGQRVPQDLALPDAAALIERALGKPSGSKFLYSPSRADLLALAQAAEKTGAGSTGPKVDSTCQLLPSLLSSATLGDSLEPLARALQHIGQDDVCHQAYEQWRQRHQNPGSRHQKKWCDHKQLAAVLALSESDRLWMVHDTLSLRHAAVHTLKPVVLALGNQGTPLCASLLPSEATSRPGGVRALADSLAYDSPVNRLEALQAMGTDSPIVHLFGRVAPGRVRELARRHEAWMALCSGKLMVRSDGFRLPLSALARRLPYTQVELGGLAAALSSVRGLPQEGLLAGAAVAQVQIEHKAQPPLALTAYILQLVELADSTEVQTVYALGSAAGSGLSAADWPRGLLLQLATREVFRKTAGFWPALCEERGRLMTNETDDARFALQAAFALWSVEQQPAHRDTRAVLQALCGSQNTTRRRLGQALLQLFAIKLLDRPAGA